MSLAYFPSRQALVNRSGSKIPVYEKTVRSSYHTGSLTAGGEQIGTIYPNEFYTIIPQDSPYITCYQIIFRNPKGVQTKGYIETSPGYTLDDYTWAQYQEPYHYYNSNGSTLVKAARETIGSTNYYVFTVYGTARTYRNPAGTVQGSLPVGTKLATASSTTGQTYGGYMLFNKKKLPGGSWQNLVSGGTYGFVHLGLDSGSFPSNRPIR